MDYEKIVKPQLETYKIVYGNFYNKQIHSLKATRAWVNYMKAGDFNPPHVHPGCRFSSVIFLKIPKNNHLYQRFTKFFKVAGK